MAGHARPTSSDTMTITNDTRPAPRLLTLLVALLLTALATSATEILDSIRAFGLPVLMVETIDGVEPTCDYVACPPGSIGGGITNATKVPGRLRLYRASDAKLLFDSGDFCADTSGITIKIRGNTSAYQNKKPYKIKLEKKADLLLRGDKRFKDKNWGLICDDDLRSFYGFSVSRRMEMPWTPDFQYVNLVVNGDYRGIYMLIELIRRNSDCRIVTDKSGFVMEMDPYWWNEDVYVKSTTWHPVYGYTFKYPEEDEVTEEQWAYIERCLNDYDAAFRQGTLRTEADLASLGRWLLAHDLIGTWDCGGTNKYLVKRDSTAASKIEMPVLWDLGTAMMMDGDWSRLHTVEYRSLFKSTDKTMVKLYQRKWNAVKGVIAKQLRSDIKEFVESEQGQGFAKSRPYDNARWGTNYASLDEYHDNIRNWISSRVVWLNKHIYSLFKDPYAATDVNEDSTTDVTDLGLAINVILGKDNDQPFADVNNDYVVDITDTQLIINDILKNEQ